MINNSLIVQGKQVKLDQKDKKILEILNTNARLSIADISRKTGIQRDSVLYRINKMKKQKVIRFFHTTVNPGVLGYPIYSFVNFMLYNLTQDKEKTFRAYLKGHPNIVYVAKTTGKWDFTISVAAKDLKHFDSIMTELRMRFSKIIKDYDTASIIEEYKYDYMVDLI
jgi:Lrp/AsnC family transcriptional regulator, leucine-responsive regulatory protein